MPLKRHIEMMDEALAAGERRDYQRAAELLLNIVSESDEFPEAYLYLGRSFHALGKLERAIQFLHFFIELEPEAGAGHFFLGRAYAAEGMYREAVRYLERAARIDPENPQVLGLLGLGYLKLKRPEYAVTVLGTAVELAPDNRQLHIGYLNALTVDGIRRFRRGEIDLARQMFEFLLERGWETTAVRLHLAYAYRRLERFDEALAQYDLILAEQPDDPALKLQRADMLLRMGSDDRAREEIADVEPDHAGADIPELHRLTAIEAFEQGRYRRAAQFAKSVIKQTGPGFEMHMLLGEASRRSGRLDRAINHFNRALQYGRKRLEPHYGIILSHWQHERFQAALSSAERVLAIDPDNETGRYYQVLCRGKLGHPAKELIPEMREEISRGGTDPHICTALGLQYLAVGDGDAAERQFRTAIDLSESHQPAYLGLFELFDARRACEFREREAELYHAYFEHFPEDTVRRRRYLQLLVSLKRYEHAIEQLQLLTPFDGASEGLRRLQAFCYRETGKYREAGIVYRQLLKERPDSGFYLKALAFCLERSGSRERAILLMERAFAYRDPDGPLELILGVLLYREERYDDALRWFRSALEEIPSDWRVYANIAAVYRLRGANETADQFESRAQELRPG